MKYSEITDIRSLDAAHKSLASKIEAKGREVTESWDNVKLEYSPAGLFAHGLKSISGNIRFDKLALWAVKFLRRNIVRF